MRVERLLWGEDGGDTKLATLFLSLGEAVATAELAADAIEEGIAVRSGEVIDHDSGGI